MSFDIDEVLRKDAFKALEPERAEAFKRLIQTLQGKNSAEAMTIIMAFMANMPKGKAITNSERDAMMAAILESMSASDQAKFNSILTMMKTMKL